MYAIFSTLVAVILAASPAPSPVPDAAASIGAARQQQAEVKVEPVDTNVATAEDLQKVPGIGEALARRIIEFREQNGRFEKVDDLLNVRGIGVASLEKLRPYLIVKTG
jgi:competence protein ComEA